MSWTESRLDEVCHLITDGKHGDCVNQEQSGYYFISAKDVFDWNIRYENARQITKEDFDDTHRRTQLEPMILLWLVQGLVLEGWQLCKIMSIHLELHFKKA